MLNSFPVRLLWHSFNWLTRYTIVALSVIAVLIAIIVMALRYWLLPDIEQYHDRITASLSAAIGNPVTIGKISGDWQGLQPHLDFSDVRLLDEQNQPALILKDVNGTISWMSLLTAQLRLASLEIDRPELLVRRDASSTIFIGGVALSKKGGNNGLADWLLHQYRVVVRDALIVWVDESRDAQPLILNKVNFRLENLLSHHRFALQALPPADLAAPLDVRGDFHGKSFDDLPGWGGTLFTQFGFIDITAWRSWLELPKEFSLGRGGVRSWLTVEGGKITGAIADMALHNVVVKLADEVPELSLANIHGRAAWQELSGGFEVMSKGLVLRLQNGIALRPTDFYFRNTGAGNGQPAENEIRANTLQFETMGKLAKYVPMDAGLRAKLDAYAPRGRVSNLEAQWRGEVEKPLSYKITGQFESLAVNQVGNMPGFSGLSFNVDGTDASGRLSINSQRMTVDAPGVLREPLSFATLVGQAGWKKENGVLAINIDNIAVVNDDMAGNLYGSYQTKPGTLGVLDLTGKLTRGDVRRAARYTPLIALNQAGNDWLNGALLAGHTEDFRIRIKGNLSDFPPGPGKPVLFEIDGHARDVVMEFDKGWPQIEKISGEFLIRGNKLEVKAQSATMAGASLQNVTVTVPDMMSKDLLLEVNGEALASGNTFLDFIQKSPVRGYTDGFTDGMRASGNSHLDLSLRVPLLGDKPVKVNGRVRVQDSDIDFGDGVPLLRNTRGVLSFTESGMKANDIAADILGGPAIINLQTGANGGVHATLKGNSNMDALRKLRPIPLLSYLHGSTNWDADINVVKKSVQFSINANLQGLRSTLPPPFAKAADQAMTLHMEMNPVPMPSTSPGKASSKLPVPDKAAFVAGQDVISAKLGDIFSAQLSRREENGAMVIKRGLIRFGAKDPSPESKRKRKLLRNREGVWLVGSLPVLSIQGWDGVTGSAKESAGSVLPLAGADLRIDKLTGYGYSIAALQIDAAKHGDGLSAKLSSSAANGEVIWEPRGYDAGGLVRARISNLQLTGDEQPAQALRPIEAAKPGLTAKPEAVVTKPHSEMHPGTLPALDIRVENFQLKGKQIGRFELIGHPEGKDWRLRRLNIANPDGSLVGDGVWSDAAGGMKTQVGLVLDISDAGKILERSGYPNTVKGGNGRLAANLSWSGAPDEFSIAALNGTLKLDTGKGRFLKMDPGAGKLLSVLSLQDLPRHIALGFTDVFSEGFQFDNINGTAAIKDGVIDTQDFHIDGSSAKVTMKGGVDLNRETQALRVRVMPTIGNSMSVIGAFAISPAVGIGSLIVNKVLGNPLDKLASFEYNVSGTWSNPDVVKISGIKAELNKLGE
ncbi:MAG: YhdP family protein [Gallionella sp.]